MLLNTPTKGGRGSGCCYFYGTGSDCTNQSGSLSIFITFLRHFIVLPLNLADADPNFFFGSESDLVR